MGCCADFYVVSGIQADTEKEAQKLSIVPQNQTVQTTVQPLEEINPDTVVTYDTPIEYQEVNLSPKIQIRLFDLIAYMGRRRSHIFVCCHYKLFQVFVS